MCAMPTASVGAPPAREMMVFSPTSLAVCVSIRGDDKAPARNHLGCLHGGRADDRGRTVHGEVHAGSITEAATSAIIATNDSISMPP
jgi:hypothetical protein